MLKLTWIACASTALKMGENLKLILLNAYFSRAFLKRTRMKTWKKIEVWLKTFAHYINVTGGK